MPDPRQLLSAQQPHFTRWEIVKDVVDQFIDLMLDYRQSGHPGGSRSKAHMLISLTLSGAMRWDVRDPGKRFADRFVLVAGHCAPLVYGMLAVYNEALRLAYERTGDDRYLVKGGAERMLTWEDLPTLRHRGGLPHALRVLAGADHAFATKGAGDALAAALNDWLEGARRLSEDDSADAWRARTAAGGGAAQAEEAAEDDDDELFGMV